MNLLRFLPAAHRPLKTKILITAIGLLSTLNVQFSTCSAATTIDAANRFSYGANLGWLDGRGDTNNGAVIGEYVCRGYIYSANVGWISLGSGAPTNGIYYQNVSTGDFGVNQDGLGNLRGYAYGANIGWIDFENTGAPNVNLYSGILSGYVWSANCGWISLSNATAYVQSDTIQQGALAPDGLPVAWLLVNFGTTNVDANADPDHDGMSNAQEYLAGTNPNDASDNLRITGFYRGLLGDPNRIDLQWTSVPTRFYAVAQSSVLGVPSAWSDLTLLSSAGANTVAFDDTNTNRFYRIRAFRPLTPALP